MIPNIIGISGNMGAGKTTLTNELAKYLHSSAIYWDDFDAISNGPKDYIDWYNSGRNYEEWDYPKLAQILKALKSGTQAIFPINLVINPTKYIIFDAPLGRFHQQTGLYIDTWVHISVPLDISLCRWILRDYKNNKKTKIELLDDLEFYINKSRPLFDDRKFKDEADLIIDGMLSTGTQVQVIKKYLDKK